MGVVPAQPEFKNIIPTDLRETSEHQAAWFKKPLLFDSLKKRANACEILAHNNSRSGDLKEFLYTAS